MGSNSETYFFLSLLSEVSLLCDLMMQLVLIILRKRKETIRYYESFGYSAKYALDKHFYRSNGVSVPTENRSNNPIMGFSLTSPYNGLFKSFL
jgi:hypothetical protein